MFTKITNYVKQNRKKTVQHISNENLKLNNLTTNTCLSKIFNALPTDHTPTFLNHVTKTLNYVCYLLVLVFFYLFHTFV